MTQNLQEKLTDRAVKILGIAKSHAGNAPISSTDVLFGLIEEQCGVAANIFINLGVADRIKTILDSYKANRPNRAFSPSKTEGYAKKIGQNYIGTELLLAGIIEDETVSQILREVGLDARRIFIEIEDLMNLDRGTLIPIDYKKDDITKLVLGSYCEYPVEVTGIPRGIVLYNINLHGITPDHKDLIGLLQKGKDFIQFDARNVSPKAKSILKAASEAELEVLVRGLYSTTPEGNKLYLRYIQFGNLELDI